MIDRPSSLESEDAAVRQPSIRGRLTRVVSLIFLVATVAAFAGVWLFIRQAEQALWQAQQRDAAVSAAQMVDSVMDGVRSFLSVIATLDRSHLEADLTLLPTLIEQNPNIIEVIRVDRTGEIVCSGQPAGQPLLADRLTIAQSPWFLSTREGHPYISEMQLSVGDEPYLVLAVPAADGGAVAARLRMDVLWDVVAGLQFGRTGSAYVADRTGHIVAHSDPEVVLAHTTIGGRPEMLGALESPSGEWHGAYEAFDGRAVTGYAVGIPASTWWVFVEVAQSEVTAVTRSALITLGGGLVLLGIVMTGLTQLSLRQVVMDPLEDLRSGVERVGQGDLGYRLENVPADEIGQVAATFNVMSARLQERENALEQARDEALAASRFKDRLLANVSHDLRTPLSSILGYAEMMKDGTFGPLTEEQAKANERILANTHRLVTMINSLLDQAMIEAGRIEIAREPFDAAKLLDDISNILGFLAEQRGLELHGTLDPDLPDPLIGDVQRLQQILMNLVGNALKYTSQGRVEMRIKQWDEAHYCIEVADTGSGIPTEAQQSIFEPFRQDDSATAREPGGVGLGLSIVKQLVTLMQGEIRLVSRVGKGSTFTIVLPLITLEPPSAEAKSIYLT